MGYHQAKYQIELLKILSSNYESIDIEYLKEKIETKQELAMLEEWLSQLARDFKKELPEGRGH
ncbi:hypothetical protein MHH70_08355 [Metasolibacillus sp. FSL H7-0170]|uniref:hypothetical protein n=1 Tax=unclassified Metasolibacillus TaxID=2703679 RepID=UPI003157F529